jgi:O-antigen/teichoic acid export membrane protein
LGTGLNQVLGYWLVRKGDFRQIAATRLCQSGGMAATQIGLGLLGLGALGLLVGDAVGRIVGVGTLARRVWHTSDRALRLVRLEGVLHVAFRYRRFPLLSSWAAFLEALAGGIPAVLMAGLYGMEVAGWLGLAQRVVAIPASLVSAAVAQAYFAECVRIRRSTPHQLTSLFWGTVRTQFLVGTFVAAGVALPAPWLFGVFFGANWTESGWYVMILSLSLVPQFVASPLGSTLDAMERQDLHLVRELTRVVLISAAVGCAILLAEGPLVTLLLLSGALTVSYAFGFALALYALRHPGARDDG